jgi:regulator of replication initiation timing
MEDRLIHIRKRMKKSKVYYSRYSPRAELLYEVDEADDDLKWMVYEIERLRKENEVLRQRLGSDFEEPEGRR